MGSLGAGAWVRGGTEEAVAVAGRISNRILAMNGGAFIGEWLIINFDEGLVCEATPVLGAFIERVARGSSSWSAHIGRSWNILVRVSGLDAGIPFLDKVDGFSVARDLRAEGANGAVSETRDPLDWGIFLCPCFPPALLPNRVAWAAGFTGVAASASDTLFFFLMP